MPSRTEGWGGAEREPDRAKHQYLFKDEQYRLIRSASRDFEQTTPVCIFGADSPSLLRRGMSPAHIQAKKSCRKKTRNYNLVTQKKNQGHPSSFLCFLCLLWLIFFSHPANFYSLAVRFWS